MIGKWFMGVIFFTGFLSVSCAPGISPVDIPVEKACSVDDDCVPSACCHAKDAVNRASAPDCQGIYCTMSCEHGTLDCEYGEVKCVDGECRAIIEIA